VLRPCRGRRRRLFAYLLEVLLHVRLKRHRDFVAVDFSTSLGVMCGALCVRRAQLLLLFCTSTVTSPVTLAARLPMISLILPMAASCSEASRPCFHPGVRCRFPAALVAGCWPFPPGRRTGRSGPLAYSPGLAVLGVGLLSLARLLALLAVLAGVSLGTLLLAVLGASLFADRP